VKKEKLILELLAIPLQFRFSVRKNFVITMIVTNSDNVMIEPNLHLTKLIINNNESFIWMEAVGNGHRELNWFTLPPHQSTAMSWSTMGEHLFQEPGEYELQLRLRKLKSERIKITVFKG
jgi:hypothetical protein